MNISRTASLAAVAQPTASAFPAWPARVSSVSAPRRRSLRSLVRQNVSLFATLTLLGSSAAYCIYALGSIAR